MITDIDRIKIKDYLQIKGKRVNSSSDGEIDLLDSVVIIHDSLFGDFNGLKVNDIRVLLNENNSLSIVLSFIDVYSKQLKIVSFDLISTYEVDNFIKNCKTRTTSKKFDL